MTKKLDGMNKICPLFAMQSGGLVGRNGEAACLGYDCAWWDTESKCCCLTSLPKLIDWIGESQEDTRHAAEVQMRGGTVKQEVV